jgi:hypothetical protein
MEIDMQVSFGNGTFQGVRFVFHGTGRYWVLMFYSDFIRIRAASYVADREGCERSKANFLFLSVPHRNSTYFALSPVTTNENRTLSLKLVGLKLLVP